ncbi:hypothetical protein TRVL_02461 [Trypanosoma vivax]|nr:hypothetical protein TRVL_02461 [Trypanosoma vivax]
MWIAGVRVVARLAMPTPPAAQLSWFGNGTSCVPLLFHCPSVLRRFLLGSRFGWCSFNPTVSLLLPAVGWGRLAPLRYRAVSKFLSPEVQRSLVVMLLLALFAVVFSQAKVSSCCFV